ncbi:hypothetical protein ACP70R_018746 [Stipagrostis hirtigluma subsp. patula]
MESILELNPSHQSLHDGFVVPPDQLPPATSAAAVVSLPVIDMSRNRDDVRRAILDAGKEIGLFQVINHGVPEEVMQEMEAVCEEFFQMPAADKADFYSEDKTKRNRLFSGTTYETGGDKYLLECLRLACSFPAGDSATEWPDKPHRLREVVEKYTTQTRGVGMEVLRLLCEGTGLRPDYFDGDISGGDVVIGINHYPRCPNPDATLGLPPHCDRNLITLILPGPVHGLEVAYKGDWIKVDPVPNALTVVLGLQLEVVTNGMLKSNEHRVMTNTAKARTSVVVFIEPTPDCLIGPAEEFLSEDNPPCYRTLTFSEFKRIFSVVKLGSSINLTTNLKDNQKEVI